MKRLTLLAIVFMFGWSIAACGGGDDETTTNDTIGQEDTMDQDVTADQDLVAQDNMIEQDLLPNDDVVVPTEDTIVPQEDTVEPPEDIVDPGDRACTDQELAALGTCFQGCGQDQTCLQGCFTQSLSAECQGAYTALSQCAQGAGCGETDATCVQQNCPDQYAAVFGEGTIEPNEVPSPYGTANINFSTDYVRNSTDGQQDATGVNMSAFATGTYGSANLPIQPASAQQFQAYAMYMQDPQGTFVQVLQMGVSGQSPVNPVFIVTLNASSLAAGAVTVDLTDQNSPQIMLADINWTTQQISCVHAFVEGSLNLTNVGDVANHGALAFESTGMQLYHPTNYKGQDISAQIGLAACAAQ